MAARQSRIRPGCAKGPPGRCISLIFAIPMATNCARCTACLPELSDRDGGGPPFPGGPRTRAGSGGAGDYQPPPLRIRGFAADSGARPRRPPTPRCSSSWPGLANCASVTRSVTTTAIGSPAMSDPPLAKRCRYPGKSAGRVAEHDIELAGERIPCDLGGWAQRHDQPCPGGGIAHTEQYRIALVARLALDIHLRDEAPLSGRSHRKMNMRRAAGIGHRPDRHKAVAAPLIGDGPAEALEIVVARPVAAAVPDIVIAAVAVALPDLDPRPRERPPVAVENMPGDLGHGALRPLA